MNPVYFPIITAAVALFALVFAIFGAAWLNGRNIERLLDANTRHLEQLIVSVKDEIRAEIKRLDQRFDFVEKRMDAIEKRLDRIERQLEAIFKPSLPR